MTDKKTTAECWSRWSRQGRDGRDVGVPGRPGIAIGALAHRNICHNGRTSGSPMAEGLLSVKGARSGVGDRRSEERRGRSSEGARQPWKGGPRHRGRLTRAVRYMEVGKEGKMDRSRRGDVGGSYRKRSKAAG